MRFLSQAFSLGVYIRNTAHVYQTKPKLTFLCFLSADAKSHNSVFVTERLVSFDTVSRH